MISIASLWMPILVSAVAVFFLSSLVHMALKWHNSDYRALTNEDEVRAVIQRSNPTPGEYMVPHCLGPEAAKSPAMRQKFEDGPVGLIVLRPRGVPGMGQALGLWFLYTLGIGVVAGYLASRSLMPGAAFVQVCRLTATVAFLTYSGGSIQNGIWMGRPWRAVAKDLLDGAIYAAATGAVFGWLWPH